MRLEVWAGSEIGLLRPSNQDAVACNPTRGVFVVADGMGGHAEGDVASRIAVDVIERALSSDSAATDAADSASACERLRAAIRDANDAIYAAGHPARARAGSLAMGTTVVALHCAHGLAAWGHVGDSRLYRLRDAELVLLTADHTQWGEMYWQSGPIPVDLAHTNVLLSALGLEPEISVPTAAEAIVRGDCFLLCSDGVSGLISARAIRSTLAAAADAAAAGRAVIAQALDAGGTDNASAVVVRAV